MKISWEHPSINPEELYELMRRNKMLPYHLGPVGMIEAVRGLAMVSRYGLVLNDEGAVMASFLYFPIALGLLGFTWIPEIKYLHRDHRDDLAGLGTELRAVWFRNGIHRVESHVPVSRSQTVKALRAIGFRQETRDGIREIVDFGLGPEPMTLLGLLASDPPRPPPPCQGGT